MSFLKSFGIGIERPPYEVIQKLDDNLEVRKYPATKWVCTTVKSSTQNLDQVRSSMFWKLFNYISGENEPKQKVEMTSPVTMDFQSSQKIERTTPDCEISMRFYVPKQFHGMVPQPTGDAHIVEEKESVFAVVRFGGYASMNDYIKYRDELIARLGNEAVNYDCVNMMTAGYDPPFKPIGRTNEVWLRKIN